MTHASFPNLSPQASVPANVENNRMECTFCNAVIYCCGDHLREHFPRHEQFCAAWRVLTRLTVEGAYRIIEEEDGFHANLEALAGVVQQAGVSLAKREEVHGSLQALVEKSGAVSARREALMQKEEAKLHRVQAEEQSQFAALEVLLNSLEKDQLLAVEHLEKGLKKESARIHRAQSLSLEELVHGPVDELSLGAIQRYCDQARLSNDPMMLVTFRLLRMAITYRSMYKKRQNSADQVDKVKEQYRYMMLQQRQEFYRKMADMDKERFEEVQAVKTAELEHEKEMLERKQELEQAVVQSRNLTRSVDRLQGVIHKNEAQKKTLLDEVGTLKTELKLADVQMNEKIQDIEQQHQDALQDLQAEIKQLKSDLKNAKRKKTDPSPKKADDRAFLRTQPSLGEREASTLPAPEMSPPKVWTPKIPKDPRSVRPLAIRSYVEPMLEPLASSDLNAILKQHFRIDSHLRRHRAEVTWLYWQRMLRHARRLPLVLELAERDGFQYPWQRLIIQKEEEKAAFAAARQLAQHALTSNLQEACKVAVQLANQVNDTKGTVNARAYAYLDSSQSWTPDLVKFQKFIVPPPIAHYQGLSHVSSTQLARIKALIPYFPWEIAPSLKEKDKYAILVFVAEHLMQPRETASVIEDPIPTFQPRQQTAVTMSSPSVVHIEFPQTSFLQAKPRKYAKQFSGTPPHLPPTPRTSAPSQQPIPIPIPTVPVPLPVHTTESVAEPESESESESSSVRRVEVPSLDLRPTATASHASFIHDSQTDRPLRHLSVLMGSQRLFQGMDPLQSGVLDDPYDTAGVPLSYRTKVPSVTFEGRRTSRPKSSIRRTPRREQHPRDNEKENPERQKDRDKDKEPPSFRVGVRRDRPQSAPLRLSISGDSMRQHVGPATGRSEPHPPFHEAPTNVRPAGARELKGGVTSVVTPRPRSARLSTSGHLSVSLPRVQASSSPNVESPINK
jgi:hypothetical protein